MTLAQKLRSGFLGLALFVSVATGCTAQERIHPENFQKDTAYYVTALNGSKVLVVADTSTKGRLYKTDKDTGKPVETKKTNFYKFYRDTDGNGFADSRGEMLYWADGTSFIIEEIEIPRDSTSFYNLEEIRREYLKTRK